MKNISNKNLETLRENNTLVNRNKAITLIALVITIVVLIILAGVIISITLGNGGIIDKTKTAKEEYANAYGYEQKETSGYANKIDEIVNGNRDENLQYKQLYEDLQSDYTSLLNNKLTLVANLSDTRSSGRSSSKVVSFTAEANTIYYIIGGYFASGGDIYSTFAVNNYVLKNRLSFSPNVTVLDDGPNNNNVLKIRTSTAGTTTITFSTGAGNDSDPYVGYLFLHVYK